MVIHAMHPVTAGVDEERKTALELFQESDRGNQNIRISNREKVLLPILMREQRLNRWYAKFWEGTDINVPLDARLKIMPDNGHNDAITIYFILNEKAFKQDKNLVMHRNITHMLSDQFKKWTELPAELHLFAAVELDFEKVDDIVAEKVIPVAEVVEFVKDEGGNPDEIVDGNTDEKVELELELEQEEEFIPDGSVIYLLPNLYRNPELKLPRATGFGNRRVAVRAVDIAIEILRPVMEDLEVEYNHILQMNALMWRQDARFELIRHTNDINSAMIRFELSPKASKSDPGLRRHRNLAQSFSKRLEDSIPGKPAWFDIGAVADTTYGRTTPVMLK